MFLLLNWLRKKRLEAAFLEIYRKNKWGGIRGDYFSGAGSRGEYALVYTELVTEFIKRNNIKSVIDLGCGDFFIGDMITKRNKIHYIGVDIVRDLIVANQQKFGSPSNSFQCLDITFDKLPDGDLCLIRQVFQHLSNSQIECVLKGLKKYKYILITEHYPAISDWVVPNKEMAHGESIRVGADSAVFLDLAPFYMPNVREIFRMAVEEEHIIKRAGETLRTFLLEN